MIFIIFIVKNGVKQRIESLEISISSSLIACCTYAMMHCAGRGSRLASTQAPSTNLKVTFLMVILYINSCSIQIEVILTWTEGKMRCFGILQSLMSVSLA